MLKCENYSIYVTETDDGVRYVRVRLTAVDSEDPSLKKETDKIYSELVYLSLQSFLLECDKILAEDKAANGVS